MKAIAGLPLALPPGLGAATPYLRLLTRPSSMILGAAGLAAVANAMAFAAPAPDTENATRLGASIQNSVSERDQSLAGERRKLEMREQAARAGEARLAADMRARQPGSANAPGQPGSPVEPPSQPYDDLARIYQTMKPARAAPIFERLDIEVQTQVAKRMRERSTALLMASMSPNAAVELTMSLAGRRVVKAPPPVAAPASRPSRRVSAEAEEVPPRGKKRQKL